MSFYSRSLSLGLLSVLDLWVFIVSGMLSFVISWNMFSVSCLLQGLQLHMYSADPSASADTLFISSSLFCFILESSLIFSSAKSSLLSLLSSVFSCQPLIYSPQFDLDHFYIIYVMLFCIILKYVKYVSCQIFICFVTSNKKLDLTSVSVLRIHHFFFFKQTCENQKTKGSEICAENLSWTLGVEGCPVDSQ